MALEDPADSCFNIVWLLRKNSACSWSQSNPRQANAIDGRQMGLCFTDALRH